MTERVRFQEKGRARAELEAEMSEMAMSDADWRHGRVPLYVFGSTQDVADVGRDAFMRFFTENALGGKRAFGSLKRMEDEVIAMTLDLFHGPETAVGNMTTGGTESIVMALKACRDWNRKRRGDLKHRGNIVLPVTAHPAFDKGASLMDIDVRRVPVTAELRADPAAMAVTMDDNTIMIVGSVPCFPHGVVDPIPELSQLALTKNVWLHVDACVGGYIAHSARELGAPIPDFDFCLPGVASLSADLHKFGFCPKPASTVFYRNAERAAAQDFDLDVWPGGRFVTSTLVGTRPGGGVSGAWAVLNFLGREGYRDITRRLLAMRTAYVDDINKLTGVRVFGQPDLTIISFGSDRVDMTDVVAGMARRNWVPGMVKTPPGLHMMMSLLHEPVREQYIADLASSLAEAKPASGKTVQAVY